MDFIQKEHEVCTFNHYADMDHDMMEKINFHKEFDSLITKFVTEEPKDIVQKICTSLEKQRIKIYAVVDHQSDMDTAQVFSYPAFTIIFGNPRMGSKLLKKLPIAAVDIPLRIAVIRSESGKGSSIIFRDMEYLFKEYIKIVGELRDWAQEINHILINLVEQSISGGDKK
ncbi:uncharacterized protein (DUF302 family) [Anoxybacillus tepidamans]|uniref:Uncharacterized protein (DUF302 family) n=1 Tax=Anoxybacteroides tepidamans TaxID=265948 RepID=A0A7W8ITF5_9BACL|nr:DUF302 domain-containing protein [Anoxybacillus tepidamans]MBB5326374.1 uncharacterized protein (DUF302 family) [Anoxybacillus tepidamans]